MQKPKNDFEDNMEQQKATSLPKRNCFDIVFPNGSTRRTLIKIGLNAIKHPTKFLNMCTTENVLKGVKIIRREGIKGVRRVLKRQMSDSEIQALPLRISKINSDSAVFEEYEHLTVQASDEPLVSIVIPTFNQFAYTYECIKSVIECNTDVAYEIIIADDASTDLTKQIEEIVEGIQVVRNEENLCFLKNCNHAASYAKGRYIAFLNNDTQVQERWLSALVSVMERDQTVGMTGSKLVYPDGRLQEAGGIVWGDGSAWNYGNRCDPNEPEYNYLKEVDYISGASICIRRALWESIGGFDERFAPAYCEDSDLAFEVRKQGYKVVYQPLSVVVHFEGVSNGTDISKGQKAYQVENQNKLYEKWRSELEKEHFQNAENVFLARERSSKSKILLMIDRYVPECDKDAGSRTVYQYIKLFSSQGYRIKFIGQDFSARQPYTEDLQQLGVEVLYGDWYMRNWKTWLSENGKHIDFVFLNRLHPTEQFVGAIRKYTNAFVAYYGHDLHFLREKREYELTHDRQSLALSKQWEKRELSLVKQADVAYYPSCVEVEELLNISPECRVRAIPAYLFDDVPDVPYAWDARKNVLFIGGYRHQPNVDAVKWLASEIMPRLHELLPNLVVNILGSNPPDDVCALQSDCFNIVGYVSDEMLEEYYASCRIAIVPLRYGAGIKGKVIEAMKYGVPVVTTGVGAEGITGAESVIAVEDNAVAFAQRVAELYNKKTALTDMSAKGLEYVRKYFSPQNAIKVIGEDFDMGESYR